VRYRYVVRSLRNRPCLADYVSGQQEYDEFFAAARLLTLLLFGIQGTDKAPPDRALPGSGLSQEVSKLKHGSM
jgi:hypothetical protein